MHAAVAIQAVRAAVNLKTMQVPIFPAEGDLQYGVQLGDRVVASNQPPPNQRADAAQYRAQLIKAIPWWIDRSHKQRIRLCADHPQVLVTLLADRLSKIELSSQCDRPLAVRRSRLAG